MMREKLAIPIIGILFIIIFSSSVFALQNVTIIAQQFDTTQNQGTLFIGTCFTPNSTINLTGVGAGTGTRSNGIRIADENGTNIGSIAPLNNLQANGLWTLVAGRSYAIVVNNTGGVVAVAKNSSFLNTVTQYGNVTYGCYRVGDVGIFVQDVGHTYVVGNLTFEVASPANALPVMRNTTVSKTADNLTLIVSANSTDTDNSTVKYRTLLNRSGTITDQGASAFINNAVLTNFLNITLSQAGNYSVIIQADDGLDRSTLNFTSNIIEITYPANNPPVMRDAVIAAADNNQTLVISTNATDTDNASITYTVQLNISGNLTPGALTSAYLTRGILLNWANVSLSTLASGTYNISAIVFASDGLQNSANITSNTLQLIIVASNGTCTASQTAARNQALSNELALIYVIIVGVILAIGLNKISSLPQNMRVILILIYFLLLVVLPFIVLQLSIPNCV
jgi:hypothetical protein